jgi:hypothetical protein
MKKIIYIFLLSLFLHSLSIDARVRVRRVGPDNRTEEQKMKDKEEGKEIGIIIGLLIVGLIVYKKMKK